MNSLKETLSSVCDTREGHKTHSKNHVLEETVVTRLLSCFLSFLTSTQFSHNFILGLWSTICLCTTCVPSVLGDEKRAPDPRELELQ